MLFFDLISKKKLQYFWVGILSTTYLGPKKNLLVVKVYDQVLLLGSSEQGVNLITELKDTNTVIKSGEVSLSGSYALASSYVGNSVLAFQVSDDKIIDFVEFEAVVEDNFAVSAQGSGNQDVDNGCSDQDFKVDWDVSVKNFGNLPDDFTVSFDTSDAVAAAWSVIGADDICSGTPDQDLSPTIAIQVYG